jgi:hypothetical protein
MRVKGGCSAYAQIVNPATGQGAAVGPPRIESSGHYDPAGAVFLGSFPSPANGHELAASSLRNQVIMCRYAAPRSRGDAGHPARWEMFGRVLRLISVIPLAQTFSAAYPALIFSTIEEQNP